MGKAISLEQAKAHPAMFLYVWAHKEFLNAIPKKHANVILGKKANQLKLIYNSAKELGISEDEYKNAVNAAFYETYGMRPLEALIKLAQGETIAGKNWEDGIYGIGSLLTKYNDNKGVTVSKDGFFYKNGVKVDESTYKEKDEYANIKGNTMVYKRYWTDPETNTTYALRYHKAGKRYYADSYASSNGATFSPGGIALTAADGSSLWGGIFLNSVNAFLNWILNLFGLGEPERAQITDKNTFPNQQADGFVYNEPMISGATALMLLAAGGMLLYGSKGKKGGSAPKTSK